MQNLWIARAVADEHIADLRREAGTYQLHLSDRSRHPHPSRLGWWIDFVGLGSRPGRALPKDLHPTVKATPAPTILDSLRRMAS